MTIVEQQSVAIAYQIVRSIDSRVLRTTGLDAEATPDARHAAEEESPFLLFRRRPLQENVRAIGEYSVALTTIFQVNKKHFSRKDKNIVWKQ